MTFAYATKRGAILLVTRDKSKTAEKRFYSRLVRKAGERFGAHLARLRKKGTKLWL